MGKAVVYEHLGDGLYSILYTPEITATAARIAELEALKIALDEQLYSTNGLVEGRTAAHDVYDFANDAFFIALDDWAACASQLPPCDDQAALMQIVVQRGTDRAEASTALTAIKAAIADNRAQYYATTQEIAYLDNTKKGSGAGLMQVWCIDYSASTIIPADTEVGTIETFGAKGGYAGGFIPRKWINIQSSAVAAYSAERDHCVKPISGIKTAAMFFNWCQWLYVMANNPQHAVGVVQSKFSPDQDYLDVVLYGTTPGASQPTGYPFVPGEYSVTLLNVPVSYLSCGATLFNEGDDVIVRFSGVNRDSPVVIGFAESPRACVNCIDPYAWPWHGLATSGVIALPVGTYTMDEAPGNGNAWLLDSGLADMDLSTEAAAEGKQWLNYSFVSGRSFRDTRLDANQYIYIDSARKCWLVELTFSISGNDVEITASIKRLGSSDTPVTLVETVACENIALLVADGNPYNDYIYRDCSLADVWTNGAKALVSVDLHASGNLDSMFSVIEITLSGLGGEDGSGIEMAATEVIGQSGTTLGTTEFSSGTWTGYDYSGYVADTTMARRAYYNSAGTACAQRLRYYRLIEPSTGISYIDLDAAYLLENDTVIDYFESLWMWDSDDPPLPADRDYGLEITFSGGLAGSLTPDSRPSGFGPTPTFIANRNCYLFLDAFNRTHISSYAGGNEATIDTGDGNVTAGLQHIDAKSLALYIRDGSSRDYPIVVTPTGAVTGVTGVSGDIYFAWNRKTGSTAISSSPICYV